MKLLQINTVVNSGSTGRIVEGIGSAAVEAGYRSYIAAACIYNQSKSEVFKIGNTIDRYIHGFKTRFFDRHGFGSRAATKALLNYIEKINPDLIHLHNLHGYYINIEVLFNYLKESGKPVVWTFHDCWPFTGHCTYFDRYNCSKWKDICFKCPNKKGYPASWVIDNSRKNFFIKKKLFTSIEKMVLVSPSQWLAGHLKNSFLSDYLISVIPNGIDTNIFKPQINRHTLIKYNIKSKYILGVANIWTSRKGFDDFFKLRNLLLPEIKIVLAGVSKKQINKLPKGIIGINRTENTQEISELYASAEVFVNPTYSDNFPTVNLEALACGTPVITYNTGGSPEVIDENTGFIVEKGNYFKIAKLINKIIINGKKDFEINCRKKVLAEYSIEKMGTQYLNLYNDLFIKQIC